jgi:hypothetical protein
MIHQNLQLSQNVSSNSVGDVYKFQSLKATNKNYAHDKIKRRASVHFGNVCHYEKLVLRALPEKD